MVNYNAALPQLAQFQAPNVLAMAQQANQMQAVNMLMQQRKQELARENAVRAIGAAHNIESPEYIKALAPVDAELALKALNYQRQAQGELRRTRLAEIQSDEKLMDLASKHGEEFKNGVRMIEGFPEQERPAAWGRLVSALPEKMRAVYPSAYSTDAARLAMSTTSEILSAAKPKESQYLMGPAGPIAIDKNTGTYSVVPEGGAAPAAAAPAAAAPAAVAPAAVAPAAAAPTTAGAQPFAAPANTPAAVRQQPTAAGAPAIGDAYSRNLDAAEGVVKNPRSTAEGFGQFINSTFVGTAKKVFPELANKSPAEILTLRGTKLADGTPIEAVLEQKFRTDNIASLASAGIQPTPGNVYLAHFLGAGGARNVLSADPNTPLSQVVSADAIKANPEVLAIRNKTVGDLQNWANSKFGNEPGLAASMTAGNARLGGAPTGFAPAGGAPMSPGAPTVNNALMANMFGAAPPQIAGALTPPAAAPVAAAAAAPAAPVQPPLGGMAGQRAQVAREKLVDERALAEARAQAAADVKRGEEAKDITRAKEKIAPTLVGIATAYKNIFSRGEGIRAEGDQTFAKRAEIGLKAALPSSVTTVLSPKTGSDIAIIENLRRDLLPTIAELTGAKSLDAVAEMKSILNSLTTPGQTDAAIVATLNNFGKKYGLGELLSLEDLRPAEQNAPAATPGSGVPRGRRGAAPPAAPAAAAPASAIPPAAISKLKADPSMAPQFDEIFGVGAAARVMGR